MAIVVERVSKRFGGFVALDDVSLEVPAGSLTALIGPSGGGKSTLLRIIAGLEQPDVGRIALNGLNADSLAPQHRGIGFVFQHYAAFKHLTVRDNIAFGLKVRSQAREVIRDKVAELIKLVQLEGLADRYPSQLSGGQRQRMALARALAIDPKVLLLDEPFGALDASVRKDLRAWLRRLHEEMHVTTIFVTHDQAEAMEIADRIAVIHQGRVEQVGTPHELYNEPANDFVMGFIGPVTSLGEGSIRPHDIDIRLQPTESAHEAMVTNITYLGFEVRVNIMLQNGRRLWAQLTSEAVEQLDLRSGEIVYIKHSKPRLSTVLSQR